MSNQESCESSGKFSRENSQHLHPLGEGDSIYLSQLIGKKAFLFLESSFRSVKKCIPPNGPDYYVAFYGNRAFEIIPQEGGVQLSFVHIKNLGRGKYRRDNGQNKTYEQVGQTLEEGTVDFLRVLSEFLLLTRKDRPVFLYPTSERRYRIYNAFIQQHHLHHVVLYHAGVDDVKHR